MTKTNKTILGAILCFAMVLCLSVGAMLSMPKKALANEEGFGIILGDETTIKGEKNEEQNEFLEYAIVADLTAGTTFQLCEFGSGSTWTEHNIDEASTSNLMINEDGVYEVTADGEYTIYLKMFSFGNNQVFVSYNAPAVAKTFDLTIIQAISDGTKWTDAGAKVAAWTWDEDGIDESFYGGWTDWATDTDGVLTLKVDERAKDIILVRCTSDVTEPNWDSVLNRIDAGKIDESHKFFITDSNVGVWNKTVEIKDVELYIESYYDDLGNNIRNFYGEYYDPEESHDGYCDFYFDLFVQTDTSVGDFKDVVDLTRSYFKSSDGSTVQLLEVYSFSVTGIDKNLTLTASILGSDYIQYDISATGYDVYIPGDALDGCDIEFSADEVSVQQITIEEENYISVEGESAAGDLLKIIVKGELDDGKLVAGTYTDVVASTGFTTEEQVAPSYIGNDSAVWFIQSGTLTVASDGSMEFNGLNSRGESVTITISAPAHTHNLVKVEGQAATEEAAGWHDYYECKDDENACHEYFEDENGTTPIENLSDWKAQGGRGYIAPIGGGSDSKDPTNPTDPAKPTDDGEGLSAGAIVGIVIGSVVGLTLILYVLGYFFLYRKGKLGEKKIRVIYSFLPKGKQ